MQTQGLSLGMSQQQKMNPLMMQSIKLMEMPIIDLRERIAEEVEKNPALDILEDKSEVSLDRALRKKRHSAGGDAVADKNRQFIEGALSRPETLQEHLLWQLRLLPIEDDEVKEVAELIIQNLNEDGFHLVPIEVFLKDRPLNAVKQALSIVHSLEPQGCGTHDYKESLAVQAGFIQDAPPGLSDAIAYLMLLEKGDMREAGRLLGCSEEQAAQYFEHIKTLSPFPGRQWAAAAEETRYVAPDIQVRREGDELIAVLNEEDIPILGINPFFMKIQTPAKRGRKAQGSEEDAKASDAREASDFARQNIQEARWFIQSINDRNHTLLRVSRAIVTYQRSFFLKGPHHLEPLTQKDIAYELGINESTVSRTARGKYMQTEWGLFELRYFFSTPVAGTGSNQFSRNVVKDMIEEIVSKDKSIIDQAIVEELSRRGVQLARRTVAKYRKELHIDSSINRA
ncbi:MAG: RNA polymerase factor sigma-54 [Spirochaetaceae bacterium]|nr:RNA polymerase factor sigma-54 [Spirochaetaceae bacterium]